MGKVQEYLDELAAAEPSGEGSRKVKRSGSGSGKSPSSKRAKGVSPPPEDDDDEDEEEGDEDEEEGDDEAEEEGEGEEEGEEEDPLSWLEPLGPRPLKAMCKALGCSLLRLRPRRPLLRSEFKVIQPQRSPLSASILSVRKNPWPTKILRVQMK